jgi:membrane-bound ClpP family serine protease
MDTEIMIAIIFIIAGAILLTVEAFSPGVFMIIPGTVLVVLGIIGYAYTDFLFSIWSPVLALAVAAPVTLGSVKMYQVLGKTEPPSTTIAETLIGKSGTIKVATEPGTLKGKIWIESEIWSATSAEPIEAGAEVTVIKSEGVHVTVVRK